MPTFFDSTADAAEASEALRGLAHASRGFDQPVEMYGVIGEYQRHWGPAIVWLGATGGMSGSLVWGPGVACLGAAWGS